MKGWTKRRVALILALALLASQMSACTVPSGPVTNENPVSNNAAVVEKTETPAEETPEEVEEDDWLRENLENIRQSLVNGDYAEVVDLLLGKQDEFADDADFNALLYIAYMGNGNENEAAELLKNPNLDISDFTDSVLENTDAMKDNTDMADIERSLMNHMLSLGESNPQAYEAVARIGANIQNDDPTDPTAYAARYIAALAAGDEAAAKAILAEAAANGITEDALKTTAIAYIEEYNLSNVTVEEAEKGKTTSTTYNAGGDVVKSEVTVDNQDGTETKYVKNSDGTVIGEGLYDKATGKLIQKTYYNVDRQHDANTGKITETLTGDKEVYEYENGVIKSITSYRADGSKNYQVTLDETGAVVTALDYSSGTAENYSDAMLRSLKFVVQDGDVVSRTTPIIDAGGSVIGRTTVNYIYDNPVGLVSGWTEYEYDAYYQAFVEKEQWNITYTFDDSEKADYKSHNVIDYFYGTKDTEYTYEYEKGAIVKSSTLGYDWNGDVSYKMSTDYVNHTSQMYDKYQGLFFDSVIDESNTYVLTQNVYVGDSASGELFAKTYGYYDGKNKVGALDVYYTDGLVTREETFDMLDANGNIINTPSNIVTYNYDESGRVTGQYIYGHIGDDNKLNTSIPSKYVAHQYVTAADGTEKVQTVEVKYDINLTPTEQTGSQEIYDANGNLIKVEYYEGLGSEFAMNSYEEYIYDANGNQSQIVVKDTGNNILSQIDFTYETGKTTVTTKDADGNVISTILTEHTEENGKLVTEEVYEVITDADGEEVRTPVAVFEYAYDEDGNDAGYSVTTPNANGGTDVTHYNAEGYAYQKAIYDTNGQLLMMIDLGEESGDDATTEGGDDTTTEGGDDATTKGGTDTTTAGSDDATTEGGDDTTTEGGDDTTTEGGDDATTESGDDTTTEGGDDATTEGGDDTTTEGGDDTTTEDGNDTTAEGNDDSTTEGSNAPVASEPKKEESSASVDASNEEPTAE